MGWTIWETHYKLNREYLSEEWQETADWINTEGDWNSLPIPEGLSTLVTGILESEEGSEEWQIYMGIQAATLTITDLQEFLYRKGLNRDSWTLEQFRDTPKYIGWAWHFLHMEP